MRLRVLCIAAVLATALAMPGLGELSPAPFSIGFAVGVPWRVPIDWTGSFTVITTEALLSHNLTIALDVGTYPVGFPTQFEGSASLLVKGWLGAACIYAGGGLTAEWRHVGAVWATVPHMNLRAGVQAWILESMALTFQVRSVEVFPIQWTLAPEVSLGLNVAIGRGRPAEPFVDGATLWLLVGLGVAALLAFLPRK